MRRVRAACGCLCRDERGQASVEYVIVGLVLIVVAAGIAAIWRYVSGGSFAELVLGSASHSTGTTGGLVDVLMY